MNLLVYLKMVQKYEITKNTVLKNILRMKVVFDIYKCLSKVLIKHLENI